MFMLVLLLPVVIGVFLLAMERLEAGLLGEVTRPAPAADERGGTSTRYR